MDPNLTDDQQIEQMIAETEIPVTEANPANVSEENGGTTTTVDEFDPNDWQLNYKGQLITPKDKQQLISYAQQGLSYSDSMAKLKQEKESFHQQFAPYKELDDRLKQDPRLQEFLSKQLNDYYTQRQTQVDPNLAPILNELQDLKKFKSTFEQSRADEELRNELQALKSAYPTENWDTPDESGVSFMQNLLQYAYDNNISSLKTAYRDLAFDKIAANAKAEALKEADKKKVEASKAGKVGGNTSSSNPVKNELKYSKEDGYDDLVNKALAMLGE